jgi:hypothetical protein
MKLWQSLRPIAAQKCGPLGDMRCLVQYPELIWNRAAFEKLWRVGLKLSQNRLESVFTAFTYRSLMPRVRRNTFPLFSCDPVYRKMSGGMTQVAKRRSGACTPAFPGGNT